MVKPAHRISSLDGIRAIAISFVLLCHYGNDFGWGDPLDIGALGVRIFFVLSGYLITRLLVKDAARPEGLDLKRFYFRRTLRIFPAFYFYLFVMLLISAVGWNQLTPYGALPALTYTSNYWSIWPQSGYVTSHTWSLSTEEQFYILWPAVILLLSQVRAGVVAACIVAASPVLRLFLYARYGNTPLLGVFYLTADHLATGCLLALTQSRLHSNAIYRRILDSRAFVLIPLFVMVAGAQGNHPSVHKTIVPSLINLSIALCIDWSIVNHQGVVGRILNARPIASIGVLSYSLYLWQQPFTHLHAEHPTLLLTGPWKVLEFPPLSLICIALCACFSYFLVERPALRLRDRLERKRVPSLPAKSMACSD